MMKMLLSLARLSSFLTAFFFLAVLIKTDVLYAKASGDQDQIILLNDSAAAIEDSNPELSKSLTVFANQKEKEWEANKAANKDALPSPVTYKEIPKMKKQIRILKEAAIEMQNDYPLIAKGLNKMAKDIEDKIKNGK